MIILWGSSFFAAPESLKVSARPLLIISGIILSSILLLLTIIDIYTLLLPTPICLMGTILGLLIIIIFAIHHKGDSTLIATHSIAALGALVIMNLLSLITEKITGQECLGLGDANLSAMGGAWLGIKGIAVGMALAFLIGAIASFSLRFSGKLKAMQVFPFGPFISLGIWGVWLTGPNLWLKLFSFSMGL